MPDSRSVLSRIEPSLEQGLVQTELDEVPELLDLTLDEAGLDSPPLLLESVDGLDFAEEELFFDEDETGLPPEDVSLSVTELEEIASSPLEDETSATGSGPAPLELSSQAVKKQSAANKTPTKILLPIRGSCPLRQQVAEWSKRLHFVPTQRA